MPGTISKTKSDSIILNHPMEDVLTSDMNRRAGRAMHTYDMLADGDRVLVAVSGGVDSLVLAWMLAFWQRKAPIAYEIIALHIDMEPEENLPGAAAGEVRKQLARFDLGLEVVPADWRPAGEMNGAADERKNICFNCSNSRRRQLFDYARRHNCSKVAFGHHQDDIIETFFINLCYAGNISTMVPRQDIFAGRLSLIRPLAFLTKKDITCIARKLDLKPIRSRCPLSENTRRMDVRNILEEVYKAIPDAKPHIFAALANVRHEYLLKPAGRKTTGTGG